MTRNLLVALLLLALADTAAGQTLALLSDINGRYGSTDYSPRVTAAVESIARLEPDLVIATGDMVAGQKQPRLDGPALDAMWAAFQQTVAGPLDAAGVPLVISAGNHDASAFPAFELDREHFSAYWGGRKPGFELLPGSEWPWRYVLRVDDLLLLAFHGTMPGRLPESEREFVASMLARYAETAEVVVVFSHLPMWPFTRGRENEILDDPALLDLLHRYAVDVYASGHHHAFFAGTDDSGLLHLSVGALGGNIRPMVGADEKQAHSYAILRFNDGAYCVSAPRGPDFGDEIELDTLPERVEGPLGTLRRLGPDSAACGH